jgi:DNA-binding NarL/FixJ family response regulator
MGHSTLQFDRTFERFNTSEDVTSREEVSSIISSTSISDDLVTSSDNPNGLSSRIAWIDPYALTRDCMIKVLSQQQPNLLVYPFESVDAFLASDSTDVDVIILYSHRSYDSSLQDIDTLHKLLAERPVIILSDQEETSQIQTIRDALRAGASGFISTRSMGLGMTMSAIRFVQSGGTFAPLDLLLSDQANVPTDEPTQDSPYRLTARQRDVLAQLQQGKANKIIAHELGMSESTAKVHIRNIMRKMGATNRTQAAFNALKHYAGSDARPAVQ